MTDATHDLAPGDVSIFGKAGRMAESAVGIYTIGLVLAVILTATSFWVANTSLLWALGVPMGLVVLAIAQIGVHLVFFLHITTAPDNTNNVLALAFGVLIVFLVVVGSLWIMTDLNTNMMMPSAELTTLMQH
jgi:cytochrome o ubiquinol oxidase operon protein cyoD